MTTVVNLNRARKTRAKVNAAKAATANRVASGRTKADKDLVRSISAKTATALDGHKRES